MCTRHSLQFRRRDNKRHVSMNLSMASSRAMLLGDITIAHGYNEKNVQFFFLHLLRT